MAAWVAIGASLSFVQLRVATRFGASRQRFILRGALGGMLGGAAARQFIEMRVPLVQGVDTIALFSAGAGATLFFTAFWTVIWFRER